MSKFKYFFVLLLLALVPQLIRAEKVKIGELYYGIDTITKEAKIRGIHDDWNTINYNFNFFVNSTYVSGSMVIPEKVNFDGTLYPLTSIGIYAFSNCTGLTSVTIPNSIISIGGGAFMNCSGLTSVTIPNSVTIIGRNAFNKCSGLTSVTIPNSVTSIEPYAFLECSRLTRVNITDIEAWCKIKFNFNDIHIYYNSYENPLCSNPLYYARHLYLNGKEIKELVIPNSVTKIGDVAFVNCKGLTSVTIPHSVTSIGTDAFEGCNNIKKVYLPEHLKREINQFPSTAEVIITKKYNNLQELNQDMMTWEQFYDQNKKISLSHKDAKEIQALVDREVGKWQEKDEFETVDEWKQRVNESTRQQKIWDISSPLIAQHNREIEQIRKEQNDLAKEYEKYKNETLIIYYNDKIGDASCAFNTAAFELHPYDAEHGTFLITNATFGDILLPVPSRENARSFKENWETIRQGIQPEFVPNGDDVVLTKLVFTNNGKEYVYDSHTEANYAVTDVKYNFKPVELTDITLADINTNLPSLADANVSSQIISKTSTQDALTPQKVQTQKNTVVATDRSDVDFAIPTVSQNNNTNTFAVIIANEDYSSNAKVPYAAKDGEIMAKYLTSAVGLPQNHVKVYKNATYGKMAEAMNYIEKLSEAYGDKMNLILYYAGHGVPDEKTKAALLLPVDGNAAIPSTCYNFDEMVQKLGKLPSGNIVIMMDACFSGAVRGEGMLLAARGVKLRSNDVKPLGNMVVLSATQGDETAYPYEKEGHGLFTFYLLKKLQENRGNVTLGELADYVIENVKQTSIVNNGKLQTPTVKVSPNLVETWRTLQLK